MALEGSQENDLLLQGHLLNSSPSAKTAQGQGARKRTCLTPSCCPPPFSGAATRRLPRLDSPLEKEHRRTMLQPGLLDKKAGKRTH
ncbi:hypothetical protein CapIbe_000874 [Capra ibex]